LAHEKALQGNTQTLQPNVQFLLRMRQEKFNESAIGVHRAALIGFQSGMGKTSIPNK
jgi:hypothetical protein